jgi:hypothetical protein
MDIYGFEGDCKSKMHILNVAGAGKKSALIVFRV